MRNYTFFVALLIALFMTPALSFGWTATFTNTTLQELVITLKLRGPDCHCQTTAPFPFTVFPCTIPPLPPGGEFTVEINEPRCIIGTIDVEIIETPPLANRKKHIQFNGGQGGAGNQNLYITFLTDYQDELNYNSSFEPDYRGGNPLNFIAPNGIYLQHADWNNLQLDSTGNTVFLTSSEGQGYQAQLAPQASAQTEIKEGPTSTLIECQQPLGNPIACASQCLPQSTGVIKAGYTSCQGPALTAEYIIPTVNNPITPLDFLNENGSQPASALNYVFLDTIVNNTNQPFNIATTTAPLYIQQVNAQGTVVASPNSIAGALNANDIGFLNSIYALKGSWNTTFNLGSNSYPVTFLSGSAQTNPNMEFSIFGKNEQNPSANKLSTKKHMAQPQLSLGTTSTSGIQTIILYPPDPTNTCQPVIFIGRDPNTNTFYTMTYLSAYTQANGTKCCQDQSGNLCSHDTLYCSAKLSGSGCALYSANPADNQVIQSGGSGRLKVVINPMPDAPQYGYASNIEVLPNLWWPGQPDFK